jgi:LuxR family maltose regulon positive regulatory protein
MLVPLEAELEAEVFARAKQRGEANELEAVIAALIAEFEPGEVDSQMAAGPASAGASGSGAALVEPLSPREMEVLALVAEGLSNREIAQQLVVTVGAVKKHINNIFGKLQAHSRTQAVARARELNLLH